MILGLLISCSLGAPPDPPPPAIEPGPHTAVVLPLGVVLGVNEGVAVPQAWLSRGLIDAAGEAEELGRDASDVRKLGAGWVRANTATYPFLDNQSRQRTPQWRARLSRWLAAVAQAGLEPVVMVGPWPGNRTAAHTDHYLPSDLGAYAAEIQELVELLDGDGRDDLVPLPKAVRYWEIDNEPDLHNRVPPKGGGRQGRPEDFQTPAQYGELVVHTARAIRAADANAVVLAGGLYSARKPAGEAYLSEWLHQPGVRSAFDVLSLHCYFEENGVDAVERTLQVAATHAPGVPVWITETSVPADGRTPWATEAWQAEMVVAIHGAALAGGAQAVFWHTLSDPPARSGHAQRSPFATHSLLRALGPDKAGPAAVVGPGGDREDKPAATVYRRMAAQLAGSALAQVREVPAEGGRLLWTGQGWLVFAGSPSPPAGAGPAVDLRTGRSLPNGTPVPAPAWIAPSSQQ